VKGKSWFFWFFVVAALGFGVYAYFQLKNNKKPQVDAISALPDSCLVYLMSSDLSELNKKINSQSLIADKLKAFKEIKGLFYTIRAFDSLLTNEEVLKEELSETPVHFALYRNSKWLASLNIKQLGSQKEITEHLDRTLHANIRENNVHAFAIQPKKDLYFTLNKGIVLVTNTPELVERSLNDAYPKFYESGGYLEFKNTLTENSLLSIYTNHDLYARDKVNSFLNLSGVTKKGHSVGLVDIQPSQVSLNGYLRPDSSDMIFQLVKQAPAATSELLNSLPLTTISFKAFGFDSFSVLKKYLPENSPFWESAKEKTLYNIENEFYSNINRYLCLFKTNKNEQIVCFDVIDTVKALQHLISLSDTLYNSDSPRIFLLADTTSRFLQLFEPVFPLSTHYAATFESRIYLADDRNTLQRVLLDLEHNRLMRSDESFANYSSQHIPEEFNYLFYCSPAKTTEDIPEWFKFGSGQETEPFQNFKHFSFTMASENMHFRYRMQLMHETETVLKQKNLLWTLNLDAPCTMEANKFINHNTGENELIVQDDNNTLYLINAKGAILWKKKISEKIQSPVYIVDAFKKEKFQMLFSSKNYLHLIDRNGQYVYGYPVKLPAETSSPLCVYDYDNDKEYRLLIACKNKTIYNYDVRGVRQEKFTPVKTEHEVDLPIQYVSVGESHYLVAVDKEGKIYTFSRKGIGRIGLKNKTIAGCKAFYVDASNGINNTRLVYVDDKSGLISKISFSDVKEIARVNLEAAHASVSFSQVDDNRSMDLVMACDNSIKAYSFSGNLIAEKETNLKLTDGDFYGDESNSFFYAWSKDAGQLFVYDQLRQEDKTYEATAMPLVTDLFKENKKYLVITNGKQLNCVLMN
jgi:hypothetical protein